MAIRLTVLGFSEAVEYQHTQQPPRTCSLLLRVGHLHDEGHLLSLCEGRLEEGGAGCTLTTLLCRATSICI